MFDYSQLEALLAVEREGSIDAAARSLGLSGSAISQRIKVLEERIGAITVSRQKPATPTAFGRNLCRHAERVILLEQELIEKNDDEFLAMKKEVNIIKVAVDQTSISTWFVDVMKSETTRNEQIRYEISIVEQNYSIELMKQGIALAAVSATKTPIQGYRSLSLGNQVYKAVMSPAFSAQQFRAKVTAEKIQNCANIRKSAHDELYREWLSQAFETKFEVKSHIIPTAEGILSAVMKDIGWAVLPADVVDPLVETGELVELIDGESLNKPLYWHYCRAVSKAIKPMNDSVVAAAYKSLSQQSNSKRLNKIRKYSCAAHLNGHSAHSQ